MALRSPSGPASKRSLPVSPLAVAAVLILLVVVGAGLWLWSSSSRIATGREALLAGELEEAEPALERASRGWWGSSRGHEGMALVHFLRGEEDEGLARLEAAGSGSASLVEEPELLLEDLVGQGLYRGAAAWSDYLLEEEERAPVLLWRAVALAGLQRPEASQETLEAFRVAAGEVGQAPHTETLRELSRVLSRLDRGTWDCLLDREGEPVHGYEIDGGEVVPGVWALSSLTGREPEGRSAGFLSDRDVHNRVVLTVRGDAQKAALGAMAGHNGGFVLLDLANGDILAAVSKPGSSEEAGSTPSWHAFTHQYEPGSIVKLLTQAAALRSGEEVGRLYPLDCKGNDWVIGGTILYDWKPHGRVEDTAHAMAVSCNTAFGKMGLMIGQRTLADELRRWGFDQPLPLALAPAETGHIWEGRLEGDIELARAAMGLDHVTTTVLHAALIAAAVANDGRMPAPRLLLEKRNVLGEAYEHNPARDLLTVAEPSLVAELKEGMRAAVTRPDGTAARLARARIAMGVKTGTAGRRESGLDAILIGYLPAERPQIAFAMVLEGGGLAGVEGARALLNFLDSWYARGGGIDEVVAGRTP